MFGPAPAPTEKALLSSSTHCIRPKTKAKYRGLSQNGDPIAESRSGLWWISVPCEEVVRLTCLGRCFIFSMHTRMFMNSLLQT